MRKFILSLAALAARILPTPVKQAIYRSGPLARSLRGALNRAAPTGLSEVEIAGGDLAGMKFALDMQTEKDLWLGTYEPDLQAAVRELIRPGMVVYDVGANVGYVTHLLARAAGVEGRVFAFEALPENAERLRGNLARNSLADRVTVFAGAVAGQSGPVTFLVHASGGMGKAAGSAGRQDEHYQAEVTVEGIALDDFVYGRGNPAPQAVKMDIEGGEVMALPGMRRVLNEAHPLMLMELHGPESVQAAWEWLTNAGYTIHLMEKGLPRVAAREQLDWKAYIVARRGG